MMTDPAAAAEEAAEPLPTVLGAPGSDPEKAHGSAATSPSSPSAPPRGGLSAPGTPATPGGAAVPKAVSGGPEASDCDSSAVEVVKEGAEACHEATVDGLRALVAAAPPIVQAYFASLRPWAEFARLGPPERGARARAVGNLRRYQSNYATLLLVAFFLALLRDVFRLAVACLIVLAWVQSERCGLLEPSWAPRIGEITATRRCRLWALALLSLGALLVCCGSAVLVAVGAWALLALAHAALHAGSSGRGGGREEGEEGECEEAEALIAAPGSATTPQRGPGAMAAQPGVGSRVTARGRAGEVLLHDPGDPDMAYKVKFEDGTCDWFPQADVVCDASSAPP